MKVRSGDLRLGVWLLLAAAAPLQAQFTTYGCPPSAAAGPQLNGFTAGYPSNAQICMAGPPNTWAAGALYSATLTDTLTLATVTLTQLGPSSTTLLTASVPPAFFQAVQTPGQPDPVTISVSLAVNNPPAPQTGTFQTNPPLQAGGPVFVSAVNAPVTWTLFTGGTPPYNDVLYTGTAPAGMSAFPPTSQTWSGTPSQSGLYPFTLITSDAWGTTLNPSLDAYIVQAAQITSLSTNSALVGSGPIALSINGTGFSFPFTIQNTPIPGSTAQWSPPGLALNNPTLSGSPTQTLNVTIPANLLTGTGIFSIDVVNAGNATSNALAFTVNPYLTALSTNSRTAGAPAFTLGVTGAGFVNGSVVKMNGTSIPTAFVNGTSLTATFPSVTAPGTVLITVQNPDTTVTPTPLSLAIVAAPTIRSLNPPSVNTGSPSIALTVTGTNFLNGMTVYFNSAPQLTTFVNNTTLTANIPSTVLGAAAVVPVLVATADGFFTPALPFSIISTGPPPLQLLTFSPLPNGTVGVAYSATFTASQGSGGGYVFSVIGGTVPPGLQFSAAGLLSGTPTTVGASQFTVQVTDSAQNTVSRVFALNIGPAPLQITTGPLANVQVNTPLNVQFAGAGGIPPYTFVEFGALPAGVTMSNSGLLSGTPTKSGSFPLLVFIDDSTGASAHQNYTLNVALPGLLITAPSPLPSGEINVPYTTQLSATGGVGAPFFWAATGLPNGLTIANNSGLIAGIPRASGSFPISVTVNDSAGTTATQNYTLVIASAILTITTGSLPNGAVGSSYNAAVSASGGSGTFTFSATGLPPGVTISSSGILSGTPTTAGAFSIVVTAADAAPATTVITAPATFKVTIAPQLVVTPVTLANSVAGTAITPVQLAATGGTPPYQFQSGNLPAGLTLASNGTLSGTPTAAGTFSFTVNVVDSSGALSSGTEKITIGLPTAPAATITGLPASAGAGTQQFAQVQLSSPFPSAITAVLTLTFAPTSGADDPSVQFATGGRTAQLAIPAGATTGLGTVGVQTGTVAGTITITAKLLAGTVDVTPTPAPSQTIKINAGAPVITSVTATRTSTGFTVTVVGFASNRGVDTASFTFSPSAGSSLQTTQLTTTVTSLFSTYYGSSASTPFGSQFAFSQPFAVAAGSSSSVLSVTVTLTNALGTSPAATANLQ